MNNVKALTPLIQKRTEGVQRYSFLLEQDYNDAVPDDRYTYVAAFATEESLVKKVNLTIDGHHLVLKSNQILDVPAGVYRLEIWEMIDDTIHAIFPSNRMLKFSINYNTYDLPNGTVSSLTLDEFERRFKKLAAQAATGAFESPKIKVGKTTTLSSEQPATVEMITNDDGTITINYGIPKGETWVPYINETDGKWHIRLKED